MTRKEQIRCWIGWAVGVPPDQVNDEHVRTWEELLHDIRSAKPTEAEARGVRAHAHRAVVAPRKSSKPAPKSNPWVGPRRKLSGEA